MEIRLDKYLADMGLGSRSQVKEFIKKGRVSINEMPVKDGACKVKDTDCVCLDGRQISYEEKEYYMLYKPAGCITAVTDKKEKTVMDYLDTTRKNLSPVGRLDKDTTGLLLITNDGELAHFLLAPQRHVDKVYEVWLDDVLDSKKISAVENGVFIESGVKSKPAALQVVTNEPGDVHVFLTIHEGKFHQVKRMFEAVGRMVIRLKRTQFGPLILPADLKEGEYRKLTDKEVTLLVQAAQKKDRKGEK